MITILNQKIRNQQLYKALTQIYGININLAVKICKFLGYNKNKKLKDFTTEQLTWLKHYIETMYKREIGSAKRQKVILDVEHLITIKNYRGVRHVRKLPVRGQRTHTNGKTQKRMHRVGKNQATPTQI